MRIKHCFFVKFEPKVEPLKFWSITGLSGKLLRRFPVYQTPLMYIAPAWWDSKEAEKSETEKFFFIDVENNIRVLNATETKIKENKQIRIKAELGFVTASAWKESLIVLGKGFDF